MLKSPHFKYLNFAGGEEDFFGLSKNILATSLDNIEKASNLIVILSQC